MELLREWAEFSDLTVIEAAYLLLGIDPKAYFFRTEHDEDFAGYCYERGWDEDAHSKVEPLLSAVRSHSISTTTLVHTPEGEVDSSRTRLLKTSFIDWCRMQDYSETADALTNCRPAERNNNRKSEAEEATNWIDKAVEIANRLGQERWDRNERQITARNICEAVAIELEKDSTTHGKRGPRSANNVRTEALKGWKFIPKARGSNGLNGSNPD